MPQRHVVVATQKLPAISGKSLLVLENARHLAAAGWQVDVLAQELEPARYRAVGARAVHVASPPLGRTRQLGWLSWRARRHARKHGALLVGHGESLLEQDVLHVHNLLHRTHEAVRGTALEPAHEGVPARMQRRIFLGHGFRHVIANSALVRADLLRRYGLREDEVSVVHPGYDPERFHAAPSESAAELRAELGVRRGESLVGLVTSGDFEKRAVDRLLKALARLPAATRDKLHVLVAGKTRSLAPYEELVGQTGMGARVHFLPQRADVETLYRALDVYVHPAHFEEFGMSVLEAMACGVPTLTGTHVGASELVTGPARDFLLSSADPGLIAARIEHCLTDASCRETLREAGLEACRGKTWADNARAHGARYEELLEAPKARARTEPG